MIVEKLVYDVNTQIYQHKCTILHHYFFRQIQQRFIVLLMYSIIIHFITNSVFRKTSSVSFLFWNTAEKYKCNLQILSMFRTTLEACRNFFLCYNIFHFLQSPIMVFCRANDVGLYWSSVWQEGGLDGLSTAKMRPCTTKKNVMYRIVAQFQIDNFFDQNRKKRIISVLIKITARCRLQYF